MRKRWGIISILRALHCSWVDFMTNTSSPGMKYICENGRKRTEKIFWTLVIISGVISTVFMIKGIYERYIKNPFLTDIENTHHPSVFFPFPAITVCNSNRILKSKAEAIVQQLVIPKNLSKERILEDFKLLWELNEPEFPPNERYHELQRVLDANRYSIPDLMLKLTQSCDEMFDKCSWENKIVNCTDIFEIRKSSHGFCCSFNYLGMKDERTSEHIRLPWKVKGDPIHTEFFGQTMGLTMLVNTMTHEYFASEFDALGILVIVHHPDDYPESTLERFVGVGTEMLMPLTMNEVYCTHDVKITPFTRRKCLLPEENLLYFFADFSMTNCNAECAMNYTMERCGCVPYYYPDNGVINTCNLSHIGCLNKHYFIVNRRRPHRFGSEGMDDLDIFTEGEDRLYENCECLGQCEQTFYRVELTSGNFLGHAHTINEFFDDDMNVTDRSLIHVFLQTNYGARTRRDTIHTLGDLISRLGGVVCLFLGCSVITVVEIVYFLFLRIWKPSKKEEKPEPVFKNFMSPTSLRDEKYPPVRGQRFRTIYVQQKSPN